MREHFSNEIKKLVEMLNEMAALTENTVISAIHAMEQNDVERAEKILEHDSVIDQKEILIEEECMKLMALYQPVARDLRFLITVLKINNEIERIGDLGCKIAARTSDMARFKNKNQEQINFDAMGKYVLKMMHNALASFAYHDVNLAQSVIDSDSELDQIHQQNYATAERCITAHPDCTGYYLDCMTISRALERIGDIATNISEDVIYLETAKIVRHLSIV